MLSTWLPSVTGTAVPSVHCVRLCRWDLGSDRTSGTRSASFTFVRKWNQVVVFDYILLRSRCNTEDNSSYVVLRTFSSWIRPALASLASQRLIVPASQVRQRRGGVGDKGRWRDNDESLSKVAVQTQGKLSPLPTLSLLYYSHLFRWLTQDLVY